MYQPSQLGSQTGRQPASQVAGGWGILEVARLMVAAWVPSTTRAVSSCRLSFCGQADRQAGRGGAIQAGSYVPTPQCCCCQSEAGRHPDTDRMQRSTEAGKAGPESTRNA
jgi:hypothetical protein